MLPRLPCPFTAAASLPLSLPLSPLLVLPLSLSLSLTPLAGDLALDAGFCCCSLVLPGLPRCLTAAASLPLSLPLSGRMTLFAGNLVFFGGCRCCCSLTDLPPPLVTAASLPLSLSLKCPSSRLSSRRSSLFCLRKRRPLIPPAGGCLVLLDLFEALLKVAGLLRSAAPSASSSSLDTTRLRLTVRLDT